MPSSRTLQLRGPLDLRLSLLLARRGSGDPTMRLAEGWAARAWRTPGGPVSLVMEVRGTTLTATGEGPGAGWALENLPRLAGEADDTTGFDPTLHPAVHAACRRHPGLRLLPTLAVTDAVVAAVTEQKITGLDARRIWRRLVQRFGEPAPGDLGLLLPVDPRLLAATPWHALHEVGLERRRAECVQRVAARAGRLDALERDTADAALQSVAGIGPWSAAEARIVALGDPDAVSVGDYHLPSLVSWQLAGERHGTDERMLELLAPWAGHRGRVLRLLGVGGVAAPRRGPRLPSVDVARIDGPRARRSGRPGSNWGPPPPKGGALPTAPRPGRPEG